MNKTELIATMAEASGLSKKDCETAVAACRKAQREVAHRCDRIQVVRGKRYPQTLSKRHPRPLRPAYCVLRAR